MNSIYQRDSGNWVFIASFVSGIDAEAFLTTTRNCLITSLTYKEDGNHYRSISGIEYRIVRSHGA